MQLRALLDAVDGSGSVSLTLIASSSRQDAAFEGFLWLGGILGVTGLVLLAISLVARQVRRRTRADEITWDGLRHLRDQGKLSKEEYESIRSVMIRSTK